ncbi:hypothetical protein BDF20DRAFT_902240 [Mycotypha africana]|uniref:uncharacterized protein n=1 Tax=Mycotypha africana TaxID=64632 RepID=UPI0022FFE100|nr:uncharacterized protein BDF20DRAFT_902240 [Mycotypha africana]KAI8967182.1 hypothetical protein BDF20DRAFT_902240 [Mycotypha africana]
MPSQHLPHQLAIPDFKQLVLYTGNVMLTTTTAGKDWNKKSNAELVQAISDTLRVSLYGADTPSYRYFKEKELLEVPDLRLSSRIDPVDRDEVEVTAKLFYLRHSHETEAEVSHIDRAIYHLQQLLDVNSIDTLIVSFDNMNCNTSIEKTWKDLEVYQQKGVVSKLGLCDFDCEKLSAFINNKEHKIKPSINQVHVEQCCSLPQDLITLGKHENIELTFNGDTTDILSTEALSILLHKYGVIESNSTQVRPRWVLKYDVFFKRRSVVADKGYIVVGDVQQP